MYPTLRRVLLALANGDAERTHALAIQAMQATQAVPPLLWLIAQHHHATKNPRPVEVSGITFPNRVGFAAGLDKQGEIIRFLQALGFGFGEMGTILPRPQSGNPKPRMFIDEAQCAAINRFGFNSDGVDVVAARLAALQGRLTIPIGGSLGKMKDTSLEQAANDYISVLYRLLPLVRFLVINVSSPNTTGLRDLQSARYLEALILQVVKSSRNLASDLDLAARPVWVKIAPDIMEGDLGGILEACVRGGASAIVVGNTTIRRPLTDPETSFALQTGGLSGKPLFPLALANVERVHRLAPSLPIIGCGGISSRDDGQAMLDAGATLLQVYTGFAFQGPRLVQELRSL